MRSSNAVKFVFLLIPAFITGALSFYALQLHARYQQQADDLRVLDGLRGQLQAQQELNVRQRQEFEGRIQQLQDNLSGAQSQMSNLAQALQDARELINATAPAANRPATVQ